MPTQWMQGVCEGQISAAGDIIIDITGCQPMDTPRPRTFNESGATVAIVERIKSRAPGPIRTLGFLGGAVAWTVEFNRLSLLEDRLMVKLVQKYGSLAERPLAYIAMVRNTAAGAIWNCAEPAGGMAESELLDLEQLGEGTELGIYQDDGWVRFLLPSELAQYQERLDDEQHHWWAVVRPGFERKYEARVSFQAVGNDRRNGVPGIWAAGPVGDISFTRVAHIHLEGGGWKLVDTESRPGNFAAGEQPWVALRRKVVAICQRPGRAPIMFELDPSGALHPGGMHVIIDGENRQHVISHLSEAILTALGWW